AAEMAEGVRRIMKTDFGIAVTGIAGPAGGTAEKPVGLVYIALADASDTITQRIDLTGDRARIRNMAKLNAFDLLRRKLMETASGKEKHVHDK
ncbi:MAG TPA: competence/damage-inducible protein A, partial [Clostridiales bacterium]|nr:competence/damage-inducible protein A [Clostridiales bacterium]